MKRTALGTTTLCTMLISVCAQAQVQYSITDLGGFGGFGTFANGMNNNGQVVGKSRTTAGQDHAFLWQGGVMTDLGTLGGATSNATAINDAGQVTGNATTAVVDPDKGAINHAFIWQNGTMSDITPGSTWRTCVGYGTAINVSGQVVGYTETPTTTHHPFSYLNGVFTDLSTRGLYTSAMPMAVNMSGQITGKWGAASSSFLYSSGVEYPLPTLGGPQSFTNGLNQLGQIAGQSQAVGNNTYYWHATVWRPDIPNVTTGKLKDLGTLGGSSSNARAINAYGEIVGNSALLSGDTHAFIFRGCGMEDLNNLIPANSGWVLEDAMAINDRGQVVGYGSTPAGDFHAYLLTPLP